MKGDQGPTGAPGIQGEKGMPGNQDIDFPTPYTPTPRPTPKDCSQCSTWERSQAASLVGFHDFGNTQYETTFCGTDRKTYGSNCSLFKLVSCDNLKFLNRNLSKLLLLQAFCQSGLRIRLLDQGPCRVQCNCLGDIPLHCRRDCRERNGIF